MSDGESVAKSAERTIVKSLTVNLYSDGMASINAAYEGATQQDVVGLLHTALGMAMRQAFRMFGDGEKPKKPLVVVPKVKLGR